MKMYVLQSAAQIKKNVPGAPKSIKPFWLPTVTVKRAQKHTILYIYRKNITLRFSSAWVKKF